MNSEVNNKFLAPAPKNENGDQPEVVAAAKVDTMHNRNNLYKYLSLFVLTIQNALLALSMRYSRIRTGDIYFSSTAVVCVEFVKLITCLSVSFSEHRNFTRFAAHFRYVFIENYMETLKVAVPAAVYVVQNNLLYVSASNLDSATYQVTYQLKILTTAIFAIVLLKRRLIKTQWLALVVLVAGIVLVQLAKKEDHAGKAKATANQNRLVGFLAALTACCLSGFAGIFFEKILKESQISLWTRNVQMSLLSLPFAIVSCFVKDAKNIYEHGFFFGYDLFVVYLVCLNAGGGLLVAIVIKYADNILKGFAASLAIVLTCFGSIYLLNFEISTQFVIGVIFVICSIFLYGFQPSSLFSKKSETAATPLTAVNETGAGDATRKNAVV